jgi:hypothetical protein
MHNKKKIFRQNIQLLFFLLLFNFKHYSQDSQNIHFTEPIKYTANNKGKFFVFWGGNGANFSKSNIRFRGTNYDFTLHEVTATHKPKGFHIDYINPLRMTIPQTNFKLGYFISNHYNISFGVDHMKYVMDQNKTVNISGFINLPESEVGSVYNGNYDHNPIVLTDDFLTFEHTDGLNYINFEIARFDDISKWFGINNTDKFQINLTEGIGLGALYPKTNTKLLGNQRYDNFHFSGYGASIKTGVNLTFFKYFFILLEAKGGYINMHDIRTTKFETDKASQSFFFLERELAIGAIFRL